jgi:cytochrome c peroxidase
MSDISVRSGRRHITALAAILLGLVQGYPCQAQTPPDLRKQILALGPWPPPPTHDPSNRVSGRPEAIALGERLFFSARLSGNGSLLCASCHETWRHLSDGRARGHGISDSNRNTPSVFDVRNKRWYGWDGANDSLWAQSIRPLLDPAEMGNSAAAIAQFARSDATLREAYVRAFGAPPPDDDAAVLADVGKALAAYQETLDSPPTPFDRYRNAVAQGDADAAQAYPDAARRGLELFVGKAGCASCHAGPGFSDGGFHRSLVESRLANGEPDRGRADGIAKLLANPYRLSGHFNDGVRHSDEVDPGSAGGLVNHFRTPGLRGVALTAPYMHDGSRPSLCEAVQPHAADTAPAERLATSDAADLVAFLRTLSPEAGTGSLAEDHSTCR